MMYEIQYRPGHALATAHLQQGESVRAEASAMVGMTANIAVETQVRAQGGGGIMGGLRRSLLGGESFFTNRFTAERGPGHVLLAPPLPGDMRTHELSGEPLLIQGGSYVSAPDSVQIDTKFQGFKGLFSGESLFFLYAAGHGSVLLSAFGAIEILDVTSELVVDTGHVVAFTAGLEYSVEKAGVGWIASYLSGEGFVLRFRGRGRLYLQTRNPAEYGEYVGQKLPARSN
jgi:uncharacterized protein (TIGR00266 family)